MSKSAKLLGIEVELDGEVKNLLNVWADAAGKLDDLLSKYVAELKMLYNEAEMTAAMLQSQQNTIKEQEDRIDELEDEVERLDSVLEFMPKELDEGK